MPKFMDVHDGFVGVTAEQLKAAHEADLAIEKDEKVRVLNALEKINQLTWSQVYRDAGLKWEAITNSPVPLPPGIQSVYSLRITQARRAVACRDSQFMRLLWIAPDHDSTYQQSRK